MIIGRNGVANSGLSQNTFLRFFILYLLNARKQLFDKRNPVGASGSEAKINTVINCKYNK